MVLSVLIATVPGRESLLSRLLWTIQQQRAKDIEVLVYGGWVPFGDKVNAMRQIATGDFSVVVDDDDLITPHYFDKVLPRLTDDIDYLDYGILHLEDGKFQSVIHSQLPHHKCPIRNDIAKLVELANNYSADRKYSLAVSGFITKRARLMDYMYIYEFYTDGTVGTEPSDKNKETQRDVGTYPYDKDVIKWI